MFDRGSSTSPYVLDLVGYTDFAIQNMTMRRYSYPNQVELQGFYATLRTATPAMMYVFLLDTRRGVVGVGQGYQNADPQLHPTYNYPGVTPLDILLDIEAVGGTAIPDFVLLRIEGTRGIFEEYIRTRNGPGTSFQGPSDFWPVLADATAFRPRRFIMYRGKQNLHSPPLGTITAVSVRIVANSVDNAAASLDHLGYQALVYEAVVFQNVAANSAGSCNHPQTIVYYSGRPNRPAPLSKDVAAVVKVSTNFAPCG
jgi:hypothetical protein